MTSHVFFLSFRVGDTCLGPQANCLMTEVALLFFLGNGFVFVL